MSLPSLILVVALAVCAAALLHARLRVGSVRQRVFAPSRGSSAAGARYAFTGAFLPQAKESARLHLPTYAAGIAYHAGILAMLARLGLTLVPLALPRTLSLALATLFAVSLGAGVGLLVKRQRSAQLRAISVPDDVIANLLVDAALLLALVASVSPASVAPFQIAGAALLVYAPLGKLRHVLFLLTSRRLWGEYYGRRGVLP